MNRLYIDDLSKLQITKIKPWVVNFRYNGEYYVLHGESEIGEGSWQTLYKKVMQENKKVDMIPIGGTVMADANVEWVYFPYRNNREPYKFLDKAYFVRKMTAFGIVSSMYNSQVTDISEYRS